MGSDHWASGVAVVLILAVFPTFNARVYLWSYCSGVLFMSLFKDYFLGSLLYQRTHRGKKRGRGSCCWTSFFVFLKGEKDKTLKKNKVKCPSDYIHCSVSHRFGIRRSAWSFSIGFKLKFIEIKSSFGDYLQLSCCLFYINESFFVCFVQLFLYILFELTPPLP